MRDILIILLVFAIYLVLQLIVFPKLGLPT
jgi:hypothetical protein